MANSERGIALIAVLWALALLSIIVASVSFGTRTELRIARNVAESAAARAASDAGVERAILDLVGPPGTARFKTDGTLYDWPFAGSIVHLSVSSELSKVDLNQAQKPLLRELFSLAVDDPVAAAALAEATVAFRETHSSSAADLEYKASGLGWGPKRELFETIEELQQVPGVTGPTYEALAPYLTVYSIAGLAQPNAARVAYTIRAEARRPSGAVFVREAVVQLVPEEEIPALILAWRQGASSRPLGRH